MSTNFDTPFDSKASKLVGIISTIPSTLTPFFDSFVEIYVSEVIRDPLLQLKILIAFSKYQGDGHISKSLRMISDLRNRVSHGKFISNELVIKGFHSLKSIYKSFNSQKYRDFANTKQKPSSKSVDGKELKLLVKKWEIILMKFGYSTDETTKPKPFDDAEASTDDNGGDEDDYDSNSDDDEDDLKENKTEIQVDKDRSDNEKRKRENSQPNIKLEDSSHMRKSSFTAYDTAKSSNIHIKSENCTQENEKKSDKNLFSPVRNSSSFPSSTGTTSPLPPSGYSQPTSPSQASPPPSNSPEIEGTIRELKNQYNGDIKNKSLAVLDGKHAGKRGKIIGFNGSNVWVLFDCEDKKIAVPLDRKISIHM